MLTASRRQVQPQPPHDDLSLPEAYQLLAALMQFVGMVLLAAAIYMQSWVWLEPQDFTVGPWPLVFYTFGIPYKLATSRNASDAGNLRPEGFLRGRRITAAEPPQAGSPRLNDRN